MIDLADALRAEPPKVAATPQAGIPLVATPFRGAPAAAKKALTGSGLQRGMLWAAAAAGALLIALVTSRSDVAIDRIALVLHGRTPAAAQPFDAQAATERLAEAVRGLAAQNEQIQSRLAAVEHDMDDMTGSITKQLQAAETQRTEDGPSVAATAAVTASMAATLDMPLTDAALAPATINTAAEAALQAYPRTEFGVDIGSGLTIQALRMRWMAIRTAHPDCSTASIRSSASRKFRTRTASSCAWWPGPSRNPERRRSSRSALTRLGMFCQPTIFDGQHLALR